MCAALAKEYGKWPHEVLLCRNDPPGPFEMSLLIFDMQARQAYYEAIDREQAKQR